MLRKVVGTAKNPAWGKLGPNRSILSGRFRQACSTVSLKCKQSKEVLLLINIFMINIFVCYVRSLYFLLFSSYKYLNLNSIMPKVLGPDDLG